MMDYEQLFKRGAMSFSNVCTHLQTMFEQVFHMPSYGNIDFDSLIYNSPICVLRHVDPTELCDVRNFPRMCEMMQFSIKFVQELDHIPPEKTLVRIVARQLWDVLEENNETEYGSQWLIGKLNGAIGLFDEDTPARSLMLAYETAMHHHKIGKPIPKYWISRMFFDVYPDEETREKDLNAEGFLPWLMPWLRSIAEWQVLPDGTATITRLKFSIGAVKTFLENLVAEIECLAKLDLLKDTDEEMYEYEMKRTYVRRNRHEKWGDPKSMAYFAMFREFGSTFAKTN